MAQNVKIAGALFPDVPYIAVPDQSDVYHSFVDTSDADAAASDILMNKTAYVNGVKLVGTGSGGGGMTMDKLWTNSDPSQSFSSQTIPLDLTDYEFVIIQFKALNTSGSSTVTVGIIGEEIVLNSAMGRCRYRVTEISTSGVNFLGGYQYSTYGGTATANDSACVPVYVFGVKGGGSSSTLSFAVQPVGGIPATTVLSFESGMTFADWLASDYNTIGATAYNSAVLLGISSRENNVLLSDINGYVSLTDTITESIYEAVEIR